jgi:hypothetical protein
VEIDNELLERGVAKERVAMFKNLQSGTQSTTNAGGDSKIRVDVSIFSILSFSDLSQLRNYFFIKNKRIFDGT